MVKQDMANTRYRKMRVECHRLSNRAAVEAPTGLAFDFSCMSPYAWNCVANPSCTALAGLSGIKLKNKQGDNYAWDICDHVHGR